MPLLSFFRRLLSPPPPSAAPQGGEPADAPATSFAVLVCAIEGSGGETATAALTAAFSGVSGLTVQETASSPGQVDDTETAPATLARAVQRARTLAEAHEAAVVVFGQMVDGARMRLHVVPATAPGDPADSAWSVGDCLDVPVPLPTAAARFIVACGAAALVLTHDEERRTRLLILRDALRDGESLVQGDESPLDGPARTMAAVCYGAMLVEMGFRTGQAPVLDRARKVLRAALARVKAGDVVPAAVVGAARLHLAEVLAEAGLRERDPERLEDAARQFKAAAETLTGDLFRDDNASIWAQYGRTMHRLSGLTASTEHMKEAVQGYRQAAAVWTKARDEDRWAELAHGMATVLGQFGEFTGAPKVLDRAVALFRGIAEVWTREANPRRWAGLQNNIGACRFAQGKRSGELPALREAAECFANALEVYQALGITRHVHVTQKNIARVERLIAVQESKAG